MKLYIKSYVFRLRELLIAVATIVLALAFVEILFFGSMNSISGQLNTYENSRYELIYILNYNLDEDNVFAYPDADIMIYLDPNETDRLAASSVMQLDNTNYPVMDIPQIGEGNLVLSKNIADSYHLAIGDKVYARYPNSQRLAELIVEDISSVEFDFATHNIDNNIGVAYLAFDSAYVESVNCKYIMFAESSMADVLAEYPQIINEVLNKTVMYGNVFAQGIHILVIEVLSVLAALWLSDTVFFSKSIRPLRRMVLKGARRSNLVSIPFVEKIVFCIMPIIGFEWLSQMIIPCNSTITKAFYILPILLGAIYCVGSMVEAMVHYR